MSAERPEMQRVMIVGQPGAGKSTLARMIGDITGLPVVHIDHIHWKAGWVERPAAEKTALCAEVHAADKWIFEGGHSRTWPERLQRCDTLVWLDYPIARRLYRVLWRSLRHRGRTRPDLPEGCPEQLDWEFYRWIWRTRLSARSRIQDLYDNAPQDKAVYRLQSNRAVAEFLGDLRRRHH